jgi:hypothetical protein
MNNPFQKLMAILDQLDQRRITYSITRVRENSVMIQAPAPGERWEIEVMGDDSIEVEVFRSDGRICGEEKIKELIECYSDRPIADPVGKNKPMQRKEQS